MLVKPLPLTEMAELPNWEKLDYVTTDDNVHKPDINCI